MAPPLGCCNPRGQCARANIFAALSHAEQRSRRTGRDQSIRHADGAWQITEAPRRRRTTEENQCM
jgi:hypothetical protein